MTRIFGALATVVVLVGLWVTAVATQSVQCGGSFVPSLNCTIPGLWNFTKNNGLSTSLPTPFQVAGVTATGVTSRTTDLNNTQVLSLDDTAITMVPAPGPGKYIDVIGVQLFFDYTATYTGGSNLRLWYTDRATGPPASAAITTSGFLTGVTSDALVRVTGTPDNTTDLAGAVNVPVVLQAIAATAFGGGNASNTLRVIVHYRIVTATGTVN